MSTATIGRGTRLQVDNGDGVWRDVEPPSSERRRSTRAERGLIDIDKASADKIPAGRQICMIDNGDTRTYFTTRYRRALLNGMVRLYGDVSK